MKLEGNTNVERLDLILALLQKKGELTYHDKIALDESIKKLEMFLFKHESDMVKLKDTIKKQESVINTYLGKGSKYSIKG